MSFVGVERSLIVCVGNVQLRSSETKLVNIVMNINIDS